MYIKGSTVAFVALTAFLVGSTNGQADPPLFNRRDSGRVICKSGAYTEVGNTCEGIAATNNVTPLALRAVNTIVRPEFTCDPLKPGIFLCIPGNPPPIPQMYPESRTSTPVPTSTGVPTTYPVACQTSVISQPDDTCDSVAATYGVSVGVFYWTQVLLNPDFDCDNIGAGVYLCIPGAPPETSTPAEWVNFQLS
ncbi:hypothetical protein FRB91_011864 [Serendipita sp. 411]|nr:hypothetical protein FRC15_009861 [Serendipita sp. 397]KAG8793285.1 hypothetical protein FRC16_011033 [Serendipita sp. 398]KAG8818920.1 hypothetical protein FRC19_010237 [Serendipita sp. 401]KAG8847356.1 hypothetical protein FRB91_011864 [Serendipita sp. 411]KAG8857509.1 hypothetical protein FRC20_000267 [Serendipita sp. 405]